MAVREQADGVIGLVGATEREVTTVEEMAASLEQGSLCRATGSTSMNARSSRSHAIFTIHVECRQAPSSSCSPVEGEQRDATAHSPACSVPGVRFGFGGALESTRRMTPRCWLERLSEGSRSLVF